MSSQGPATNPSDPVGYVHSTESFGAVDGPGIRFLIFLQGCRMRCQYCHNPDTWDLSGGRPMHVLELLDRAERFRPYWGDTGGITVSGGEALLQLPFLTALFEEAKRRGISTCLDTAGQPFDPEGDLTGYERLTESTDLILLDLKQIDSEAHRRLTGHGNERILAFASWLSERGVPVWIRYVLVPGINDSPGILQRTKSFIDSLKNAERVEVLPYHTLGIYKWEALGLSCPLKGVSPPDEARIALAREILGAR